VESKGNSISIKRGRKSSKDTETFHEIEVKLRKDRMNRGDGHSRKKEEGKEKVQDREVIEYGRQTRKKNGCKRYRES